MEIDQGKALVRRVYDELFNRGNLEVVDELFTPDFVTHLADPLPNQPLHGPEAVSWYVSHVREAFPDVQSTVDQIIAEGDFIASRVSCVGTHKGWFVFVPPTGKRITVIGIDIARLEGGKIAEHWGGWNVADIMYQLGALPTPEGTIE